MKKTTLLFAVLMAFTMFTNAQTELLSNGSFETWTDGTPEGWKTKLNNGTISGETSIVADGTKSLKFECPAGNKTSSISQTVNVTAGKKYQLSMSYYIESGDGTDIRIWSNFKNGSTYLSADELGAELLASLKGPDNKFFPDEKNTWKTYTIEFVAPTNATSFSFEFRQYKGSVVYWDNMSFVERDGASTEPTLSVNSKALNFTAKVGVATEAQILSLSASNLTATPTYKVSGSDATMFTATGTLNKNGGNISIVFNPKTAGEKNATLTISTADGLTEKVELTGEATSASNPYGLDDSTPLSELNEDFESGIPTTWTNLAVKSTRNWAHKTHTKDEVSNSYAQMSAYKATEVCQALLISPAIDFDQIDKNAVSFDWNVGYANGATLVIYVMDKPGTKTEVKTINATEPAKGYGSFGTETLDLSLYSGVKFLAFEYNGDATKTTTYQIDNVKISKSTTGLFETKAKVLEVWNSDSAISFTASNGESVDVYNITGKKLISTTAKEGINTITCREKGIILVKVGNRAGKVIL